MGEERTDSLRTPHQVRSQTSSIVYSTSANHIHGLPVQGGFVSLHRIDTRRDEDAGGGVASVSASLAGLRADDVDASGECFGHMFRVSDHVHDGDACFVQRVDGLFGWDTDGADEECRLFLDDDFDELRKLAFRVIILSSPSQHI